MPIFDVSAVLCSTDGYAPMIFIFFKPNAMLFDLGGTAKSRNFAHVRVHRRPVHRSLALGVSQVHRLVHDLQTFHFIVVELVEFRAPVSQNENAYSRSHMSFCIPLPHFPPGRRGAGSSKSVEAIFRTAESNLGALNWDQSALLAWVNARCGRG
jgi:hypothetical protein